MRTRWSAVVLAAGLTMAACGVPTDPHQRAIDPEEIPPELAEAVATTVATTTTVPPPVTTSTIPVPTERVRLYFAVDDRVTEVTRVVTDLPVTPSDTVALLAAGALPQDAVDNAHSLVRAGDVTKVAVAGGTATVDLVTTFTELAGPDQVLAVAQVVLTLTARPGIGRVAFRLDGVDIEVPRADGALGGPSVSREDYETLVRP